MNINSFLTEAGTLRIMTVGRMNFGRAETILDPQRFVVAWEDSHGKTLTSQVWPSRERAEVHRQEIAECDVALAKLAKPCRLNLRVVSERELAGVIPEGRF